MNTTTVDHSKIPDLEHRNFRNDDFWKQIPAWASITRGEFSDHMWQLRNSITKIEQVKKVLDKRMSDEVYNDILDGQRKTPMNIRITPYIFASSIILFLAPSSFHLS